MHKSTGISFLFAEFPSAQTQNLHLANFLKNKQKSDKKNVVICLQREPNKTITTQGE